MRGLGYMAMIFGLCLLFGCSEERAYKKNAFNHKFVPFESATHQQQVPVFHCDGILVIISSSGKKVIDVDYELANTPEKRTQGLMYRTSMDEQQSMLFVFEDIAPRFFYMKNTYIPLDIVFLDDEKKIIKIYHDAKPQSEELLPSVSDARYVLEVCAGFCQRHSIGEGDSLEF